MNLLDKIKPLPDHLASLTEEFKSRGGRPKIPVSSLPELNRKLWGFKPGELVVVGARTSQGKSSFVSQIAWDIADQNIPVLFLSLEMTVDEILERMFCNVMKVNNYDILRGDYNKNPAIRAKYATFCEMIKELSLIITCGVGQTFQEVLKTIELLTPQPKVVVLDYIQAVRTKASETRGELDEYIRYFRQLALEKKFCGILCSQVNRGAIMNKDNEPNMAQLKSTGTLEEHADRVLLLHWEYHYNDTKPINDYTVVVSKNRNGKTGKHLLQFNPEFYEFEECSQADLLRRRNQ